MQPDIEKYMPMLEEFDLTHEQKIELIHTLWGIMTGFKDKAFGLDPTQQVLALDVVMNDNEQINLLDSPNENMSKTSFESNSSQK